MSGVDDTGKRFYTRFFIHKYSVPFYPLLGIELEAPCWYTCIQVFYSWSWTLLTIFGLLNVDQWWSLSVVLPVVVVWSHQQQQWTTTTHMDWAIIVIPISSPLMIGHNCCSVPRLLHEVVNLIVHAIQEPRTTPRGKERMICVSLSSWWTGQYNHYHYY